MPVICKRCLLSEMEDQRPLQDLMEEWRRAIPQENKAAPARYRARLAACKTCDQLLSGLCRLCGCYVELRAAKRKMDCPNTPPRWPPEPGE